MWPIIGQGAELKKSLGDFLKDRLRMSPLFLNDMGPVAIKRVAGATGSKYENEVTVLFSSVQVRDAVRRGAKELAGDKDAGIRLEVPYAMQSSLKALDAVSYHLKQKHPRIRRNIKFDDDEMSLVLDFNLDPDGSGGWRQVTAKQAKQMKIAMKSGAGHTQSVSDQELTGLLDMGITP